MMALLGLGTELRQARIIPWMRRKELVERLLALPDIEDLKLAIFAEA